jgi:phenylalanyl-tRNA synthetase beta chain
VPFYRSDILQECDIAEDVGISYGYNNIEFTVP